MFKKLLSLGLIICFLLPSISFAVPRAKDIDIALMRINEYCNVKHQNNQDSKQSCIRCQREAFIKFFEFLDKDPIESDEREQVKKEIMIEILIKNAAVMREALLDSTFDWEAVILDIEKRLGD